MHFLFLHSGDIFYIFLYDFFKNKQYLYLDNIYKKYYNSI